jgi:hypothetical protein
MNFVLELINLRRGTRYQLRVKVDKLFVVIMTNVWLIQQRKREIYKGFKCTHYTSRSSNVSISSTPITLSMATFTQPSSTKFDALKHPTPKNYGMKIDPIA